MHIAKQVECGTDTLPHQATLVAHYITGEEKDNVLERAPLHVSESAPSAIRKEFTRTHAHTHKRSYVHHHRVAPPKASSPLSASGSFLFQSPVPSCVVVL
jgi:hypothetical protein